jgi:hypothetical protein
VVCCSVAGLLLEGTQLAGERRGGREEGWQAALHVFMHVAHVVVLVSVTAQNCAATLVTSQLWFTVSLLASSALVEEARAVHRERVWGRDRHRGGDKPRALAPALGAARASRSGGELLGSGPHKNQREGRRVGSYLLLCGEGEWQWQQAAQLTVQLSSMGRLLFFLSNHKYDFGTMQVGPSLAKLCSVMRSAHCGVYASLNLCM